MNSFFTDKKVLIIGGTGTIGQSLLKRLLLQNPSVIRIFSRDEHKQFELQQQMNEFHNIRYLIGDVRDAARLERAMQGIDYVFHVAAMKHVPACEYNPFEAVQTNIVGTQNVIQAALNSGVKRVVFTSTDKAISPTNTYGASKLMAERLISSAQYHSGANETIFAAVRFGNVMGSRGSVIPLFKSQIRTNNEITVTDMSMSRFMMTVNQATSLTMRAMERALGGEVFVLKMPVISLADLASVIIEETAAKFEFDPATISIREIGLRPGEKMYEELMTYEEATGALELPDMFVIPNAYVGREYRYEDAKPADKQSYSSYEVVPLSKQDVRILLREEGLL
ncbi:UDP-N-acetylglucosamine 4,6-dehydratase family protein [Aneurinibacillus uraniidurans]|uniref:UDP-N-acetylglucosamine 4,6-dehydratase family protein n=1 Tax=Aneurinibacillus uraniidurans TaxID=2966586 RepID=UPI00234A0923|nr:UDP-N-acetylglucosamine 4,6-dehydratase family protein [Aneurinibacillus sp. B1]WCN38141.1 polysaccharide biosynthesis protein [Aneurinibacillus sp. B1]